MYNCTCIRSCYLYYVSVFYNLGNKSKWGISKHNHCKVRRNLTTYCHSGVEQEVRFLEDNDAEDGRWKCGDDYMSVSAYSQKRMPIQIQAKPTAWLLLRTVTEESKLKSILLDHVKISIFFYIAFKFTQFSCSFIFLSGYEYKLVNVWCMAQATILLICSHFLRKIHTIIIHTP